MRKMTSSKFGSMNNKNVGLGSDSVLRLRNHSKRGLIEMNYDHPFQTTMEETIVQSRSWIGRTSSKWEWKSIWTNLSVKSLSQENYYKEQGGRVAPLQETLSPSERHKILWASLNYEGRDDLLKTFDKLLSIIKNQHNKQWHRDACYNLCVSFLRYYDNSPLLPAAFFYYQFALKSLDDSFPLEKGTRNKIL
jgi:hypothetical protein